MANQVTVRITGICIIATKPNTDGLTIIMPVWDHQLQTPSGKQIPQHMPYIIGVPGVGGQKPYRASLSGKRGIWDIRGCRLESNLPFAKVNFAQRPNGANGNQPDGNYAGDELATDWIANIDAIWPGKKLKSGYDQGSAPSGVVATQITLGSGSLTAYLTGTAVTSFEPPIPNHSVVQTIARAAILTVDDVGGEIQFNVSAIGSQTAVEPIIINTATDPHIVIGNTEDADRDGLLNDLPPKQVKGTDEDFLQYYTLLEGKFDPKASPIPVTRGLHPEGLFANCPPLLAQSQ